MDITIIGEKLRVITSKRFKKKGIYQINTKRQLK